MAYNKQTFSPGQTLMAEDLNTMSEGIASKLEFVDVEALPKNYWKGTAVPNSGTLSAFYANFNLSDDEITELLSKLTYTEISADGETVNMYVAFCGGSGSEVFDITVIKMPDVENGFGIASYTTGLNIWFSKAYAETQNLEPGWQDGTNSETLYDTPIPLNNTFTLIDQVFEVGTQNELLSSLFSTTPFEYIEEPVEENAVYRVKNINGMAMYEYSVAVDDSTGEVISTQLEKISDDSGFNFIVVDELPESGTDAFASALSGTNADIYYDKTQDNMYIWSGEISNQYTEGAMPLNEWITMYEFMQMVNGENVGELFILDKVEDIPPYSDGVENNAYYVKIYIDNYYVYKNGKFVELITSDTITDHLSGNHLYENTVILMDKTDRGLYYKFYLTIFNSSSLSGFIEKTAKELFDYIRDDFSDVMGEMNVTYPVHTSKYYVDNSTTYTDITGIQIGKSDGIPYYKIVKGNSNVIDITSLVNKPYSEDTSLVVSMVYSRKIF